MRTFSIGKSAADRVIDAEPVPSSRPRPNLTPAAETTVRKPERETIICDDIHIRGDITSQEKLLIEGVVEGEVNGRAIEIGQQGRVVGSIVGEIVTVRGRVEGMITATTVQLAKTAIVEGDILHQGIGIEMGTRYDGRLKWNGEPRVTDRSGTAMPADLGLSEASPEAVNPTADTH